MLAKWTRILPHFVVVALTKRYAERLDAVPGFYSSNPYDGEIFSWCKPAGGEDGK
jgi:hypothetical protein